MPCHMFVLDHDAAYLPAVKDTRHIFLFNALWGFYSKSLELQFIYRQTDPMKTQLNKGCVSCRWHIRLSWLQTPLNVAPKIRSHWNLGVPWLTISDWITSDGHINATYDDSLTTATAKQRGCSTADTSVPETQRCWYALISPKPCFLLCSHKVFTKESVAMVFIQSTIFDRSALFIPQKSPCRLHQPTVAQLCPSDQLF